MKPAKHHKEAVEISRTTSSRFACHSATPIPTPVLGSTLMITSRQIKLLWVRKSKVPGTHSTGPLFTKNAIPLCFILADLENCFCHHCYQCSSCFLASPHTTPHCTHLLLGPSVKVANTLFLIFHTLPGPFILLTACLCTI